MYRLLLSFLIALPFIASAHEHGKNIDFIANQNQWDSNVLFRASVGGGAAFLESDGITYSFLNPEQAEEMHDMQFATKAEQDAYLINGHAWKMEFINASEAITTGQDIQDHYYNFFIGNDPSQWASKVGSYHEVLYE